MRTIKNYSGWMAEEIAKTYLLETGLLDISISPEKQFNFFAVIKKDFKKVIAIEVKASKYTKSEILREYKKIRESYVKNRYPVIVFYINYLEKTGLIEVINKKLTSNLIPLTTDNLIREVERITIPNTRLEILAECE